MSTTQPESSDSSDGGRRRETMVISSDSGSSGDGKWLAKFVHWFLHRKGTPSLTQKYNIVFLESGSWEQKSENGVHKPKVTGTCSEMQNFLRLLLLPIVSSYSAYIMVLEAVHRKPLSVRPLVRKLINTYESV